LSSLVLLEIDCRWSDERCDSQVSRLPEEIRQRAARYLAAAARRNLIASRSRLREVLELLGLEQESIVVADNGRPYHREQKIQFNLSHSHDRAVLALSRDIRLLDGLGVDIEWTGRRVDYVGIGKRFFTPQEHRWIGSDAERFFRVWTRKEAVLKSNGVGLRVELESFDVMSDRVAPHVTGRPLVVSTIRREGDYLVSWSAAEVPAAVVVLSDSEPAWASRLRAALD
jgi:4'-phosphopantetheinyl transferase